MVSKLVVYFWKSYSFTISSKLPLILLSDSNPSVHEARLMHKIEIYFELFIMSLFLRLECELNVETDVTCSRHAEHINALQSITY